MAGELAEKIGRPDKKAAVVKLESLSRPGRDVNRVHLRPADPAVYCSPVPDPMVDSWLLMSSPVPVLSILGFYLYFVLKLGPQLMATRKAFNLQRILVAYNFYQVVFSLWLSTMVRIARQPCASSAPNQRALQLCIELRRSVAGFEPRFISVGFVIDRATLEKVSPEYFCFPCQSFIPQFAP
jgi:hypothetical protein